jgi:hypothetical protein
LADPSGKESFAHRTSTKVNKHCLVGQVGVSALCQQRVNEIQVSVKCGRVQRRRAVLRSLVYYSGSKTNYKHRYTPTPAYTHAQLEKKEIIESLHCEAVSSCMICESRH